ncbi:polysaccharide pyruvyl transferase family protein [Candidatus Gracilibacteria bacterium]|nr:polysaccharide pyruvyl transferase family protein [Candidatus Gracilibacteria bacterium]
MEAFLKGFYGYKNFGDEMLFFGLINWIDQNYDISKLTVEVGDKSWMENWIRENKEYMGPILDKLDIVPINRYRLRYFSHIVTLLGIGPYKKLFKFFGGGEVLDDSRKFPHDGRNIALLYSASIRKKYFILLGGIGTIKKKSTKRLYNFILPRAQNIVCRENVSFNLVNKYNKKSTLLRDFSKPLLEEFLSKHNKSNHEELLFPYILINISPKSFNHASFEKIQKFCKNYPKHKKIFFPCDMNYDEQYFDQLKKMFGDLEIYNRTKHSLQETLQLFYNSDGGIGARLHFLYPLKFFKKNIEALTQEEKVEKLIFN